MDGKVNPSGLSTWRNIRPGDHNATLWGCFVNIRVEIQLIPVHIVRINAQRVKGRTQKALNWARTVLK